MRKERIKKRKDFLDINVNEVSTIPYEPYNETPSCLDYKYGERREITLRNKNTGELEKIRYKLSGAVPFASAPGYYWYWGDIEANGPHCCLAFYYEGDGKLRSITASFCAPYPTDEEFAEMNRGISYAAEFSTRGSF